MSDGLKEQLARYRRAWTTPALPAELEPDEQDRTVSRFEALLSEADRWNDRNHFSPGHVTGAALVVDPTWNHVLLTHHRKLGKWLQLGGHSEEDRVEDTALREAREESGLADLTFAPLPAPFAAGSETPAILDLDIHAIPARGSDPRHLHYDVRYLVMAPLVSPTCSEESHEVRWFSLAEAEAVTEEPSMHRQFRKLRYLASLRGV